ncbi:MAG: ATP-dependent Clp protease ATP-binding subunit [bacterium]|nr:ATP-dependent Clp protease ATP-binding subunit [bacterium]
MRQFLTSNDLVYRDLEERCRTACIRFRNQELPRGCRPDHADIGFEVTSNPPAARLYVTRGVQYDGADAELGNWLRAGVLEFADFAMLRSWISGPLSDAFEASDVRTPAATVPQPSTPTAAELTDMDAVHEGLRKIHNPLYLDENLLVDRLSKRVLGQDDALKGLAAVMVRHLARRHPARPAVVFAVGPSGVGKTRTAEVTAQVLREFNDDNNAYQFLRLDMTEYQEAHRVSQLIGAPQGYIGHGDGSQLADALRANPRTIVLFDEIEKAHPAILRVLVNAMDAGRLSTADNSSQGREIDCRMAVFMFTSNLDAKAILEELETRDAFGNRAIEDDVCRRRLHAGGIAPEIVGRIGRFLVFRPLSDATRAEIVAMAITEVASEYGVEVDYVEADVIVELMQRTRSQNFGVRPEKFLIDDLLGGAFAAAAQLNAKGSFTVAGPPFECRLRDAVTDAQPVTHVNDSAGDGS